MHRSAPMFNSQPALLEGKFDSKKNTCFHLKISFQDTQLFSSQLFISSQFSLPLPSLYLQAFFHIRTAILPQVQLSKSRLELLNDPLPKLNLLFLLNLCHRKSDTILNGLFVFLDFQIREKRGFIKMKHDFFFLYGII